jgi:transcriptional regulator with XRE-family HTH domain
MDVRRKLGLRLQRLRQDQGISQEELADRADVHRTYVSGVERGVRNPTVTVLEKLATGLGVDLAQLVTFER